MMIIDRAFKFITNDDKQTVTIAADFPGDGKGEQSITMPMPIVEDFFKFMSGVAFMKQIMQGDFHTNEALAAELERTARKS